ncbi:MAG: hypothetical protein NC489_31050, partial [Ruminococcus flavefaciens]|nr:hypothetical protein [Ruminococcus flavefaciens]
MKIKIRIFTLFLFITILFISILNYSFVSYASDIKGGGGTSRIDSPESGESFSEWCSRVGITVEHFIYFIVCQVGAVVSEHDFSLYLSNHDSLYKYIESLNAADSVSVNDNGIAISDDLVKFIKQALKEYAEETNGYIIVPSVHFSTLSTSTFSTSYQYNTVKALVNEYGLVGVLTYSNGGIMVRDFTEYLNGNAGFYIRQDANPYWYVVNYEDLLTWKRIYYAAHSVDMRVSC